MSTGGPTNLSYELMKEVAILSKGRSPAFYPQQFVYNLGGTAWPQDLVGQSIFDPGVPQDGDTNLGIDTRDYILAKVGIRNRLNSRLWASYYRVDLADAGENYGISWGVGTGFSTVTVPGITGDIPATTSAVLAALNGDPGFSGAGGVAAPVPDRDDLLIITFPVNTPTFFDIGASLAPFQSLASESIWTTWRVWGMPLGQTVWQRLHKVPSFASADAFSVALVNVAGYDRIYVEVMRTEGYCLPFVAPEVRDDRRDIFLQDAAALLASRELSVQSFPTVSQGNLETKGTAPNIMDAPESAILTALGGIKTVGMESVQVAILPQVGTTFDMVQNVYHGDVAWYPINNSILSGLTSYTDITNITPADRFIARISAVVGGGKVFRVYREIPARGEDE